MTPLDKSSHSGTPSWVSVISKEASESSREATWRPLRTLRESLGCCILPAGPFELLPLPPHVQPSIPPPLLLLLLLPPLPVGRGCIPMRMFAVAEPTVALPPPKYSPRKRPVCAVRNRLLRRSRSTSRNSELLSASRLRRWRTPSSVMWVERRSSFLRRTFRRSAPRSCSSSRSPMEEFRSTSSRMLQFFRSIHERDSTC
mmetsp:Transcript_27397/g.79950  ORF Transcript_27397/g.79950 Transcript_27397/m.79950 type:complete len:200 (-) Transcript_27397:72-671(-)